MYTNYIMFVESCVTQVEKIPLHLEVFIIYLLSRILPVLIPNFREICFSVNGKERRNEGNRQELLIN